MEPVNLDDVPAETAPADGPTEGLPPVVQPAAPAQVTGRHVTLATGEKLEILVLAAPEMPKEFIQLNPQVEAVCLVRFEIRTDGLVGRIIFHKCDPMFHASVTDAMRKLRFAPLETIGQTSSVQLDYRFVFRLKESRPPSAPPPPAKPLYLQGHLEGQVGLDIADDGVRVDDAGVGITAGAGFAGPSFEAHVWAGLQDGAFAVGAAAHYASDWTWSPEFGVRAGLVVGAPSDAVGSVTLGLRYQTNESWIFRVEAGPEAALPFQVAATPELLLVLRLGAVPQVRI
jgi:hypothetical protein